MSKTKLFDVYSVKELLAELSKIKYTELGKDDHMVSENYRDRRKLSRF